LRHKTGIAAIHTMLDNDNDSDNVGGSRSSQWWNKVGGTGSGGNAGSGGRMYGGVGLRRV